MSESRARGEARVRWILEPHASDGDLVGALTDVLERHVRGERDPAADGPWSLFREARQRAVYSAERGGRRYFAKLYEPRTTWRLSRLGQAFHSPARRTVGWFRCVRALGVATVPLVAAGELVRERRSFRFAPSFTVTSSTPAQATLDAALRDGLLGDGLRAAAAERLAAIVATLHRADLGSLELHERNVLVDTSDGSLLLFDLDRLGRMRLPHKRRRVVPRDLATVERARALLLGSAEAPLAVAADGHGRRSAGSAGTSPSRTAPAA